MKKVKIIAESGLDSIRISLNSARPELYRAYFRPKGYDFYDVVESMYIAKRLGLYVMINYLIFPGITDQEEEFSALKRLIEETKINFIHFKNLCIDPVLYLNSMKEKGSPFGIRRFVQRLKKEFPNVEFGYFNKYLGDAR